MTPPTPRPALRRRRRHVPPARTPRVGRLVTLALLSLMLTGCGGLRPGPAGDLSIQSAREPDRTLPAEFDTRLYSFDDPDSMTIVLVQGPPDAPEQAMTIRLFWRPSPGLTPLTREATNAMVRYIRFEPGQAGERGQPLVRVYSGAGFLWPRTSPGSSVLRAGMREATLRLIDVTDGEAGEASIIEATLTGRLRARRDDEATRRTLRTLQVAVSDALRYPRLVSRPPPEH